MSVEELGLAGEGSVSWGTCRAKLKLSRKTRYHQGGRIYQEYHPGVYQRVTIVGVTIGGIYH